MFQLGFAIDREAISWLRSGRVFWCAYGRGFDHLVLLHCFGTGGLRRLGGGARLAVELRGKSVRRVVLDASIPADVSHEPATGKPGGRSAGRWPTAPDHAIIFESDCPQGRRAIPEAGR